MSRNKITQWQTIWVTPANSNIILNVVQHLHGFYNAPSPICRQKVIWVIVDHFSKFAHFITLPTKFNAHSLTTIFIQSIYKLHGLPKSIIYDRDPIFLNGFWQEIFKQLGRRLNYSTAYHPQCDGQTEVLIFFLQSYLRALANEEPHVWQCFLYLAKILV